MSNPSASPSVSPDAVLHLATLHLLAQAGFASTSQAASLTLSTVVAKYIRWIATSCVEKAAFSGRGKVGYADVLASLGEAGEDVDGLCEFMVDQESRVAFRGGLDGLHEYLQSGKTMEEPIAEMRLIPDELLAKYEEEEDEEEDERFIEGVQEGDVEMSEDTIPQQIDEEGYSPSWRISDNDPMSWLPPLPGHTPPQITIQLPSESRGIKRSHSELHDPNANIDTSSKNDHPSHPDLLQEIPTSTQSIADRYRHAIPYTSSQLSQKPRIDPPTYSTPVNIPLPSSSFPSLLETYKSTASEPSVSLRQTDLRRQANELLGRSIATPDQWVPRDTLIGNIPGPRISPIIPSHSESGAPPILIPINPDPQGGLLSALVHQIRSPHLPPPLRTRLTGLRPPVPLKDIKGSPIFYGGKVRAPDDAARDKARGKTYDPESETFLRYTWDSGPKGQDKWGKAKLPVGKKVIRSGVGEDVPREPTREVGKLKIRVGERGSVSPGGQLQEAVTPGGGGGLTIKLPGFGGGGGMISPQQPIPTSGLVSAGQSPSGITFKLPSTITAKSISPQPSMINGERDNISPKTIPQPTITTPTVPVSETTTPGGGAPVRPPIKLKFGSRVSFSDNTSSTPALPTPGGLTPGGTNKIKLSPMSSSASPKP